MYLLYILVRIYRTAGPAMVRCIALRLTHTYCLRLTVIWEINLITARNHQCIFVCYSISRNVNVS